MRRSVVCGFAASLAAALVIAPSRDAHAGFFIGGEFDAAVPVALPTAATGYGFVGSLAYRIGLGPVFVQPEAQGSYMGFLSSSPVLPGQHATRILGGARVGLARMIQPAVVAHAGVGWLGEGRFGHAFDAGLALGFKVLPLLRFGVQGAYNVLTVPNDTGNAGATTALKWMSFGVHAGVEF